MSLRLECVAFVVATAATVAAATSAPPTETLVVLQIAAPLIEARTCRAPETDAPAPDPVPAADGGTVVTLTIPARTFVVMSGDGQGILSAATNTGCAPAASDDMVVVHGAAANIGAIRALVDSAVFGGDWSEPGVWHELAPGH